MRLSNVVLLNLLYVTVLKCGMRQEGAQMIVRHDKDLCP